MRPKTLADVLTAYADQLGQKRQDQDDYLTMFPEYKDELASLMSVAAAVKKALRPVKPPRAYREALHRDLLATAQQKMKPSLIIRNPFDHRRLIIIGAAIGSAVSVVAGIIAAVLIHNKALHRAQETPSA